MKAHDNKLLLFNAQMLLNKREVLESLEDYITHLQQKDNGESMSEGRTKLLLGLCEELQVVLRGCNIPTLSKPWYCYEFNFTNDSIKLEQVRFCDVDFDDEGMLSEGTSDEEYCLAEVKCRYVNVEEYALICGVTSTTVRQWIRRGKLRTAKKVGREWLIPALAETPHRGFEPVDYFWQQLPETIIQAFPSLAGAKSIYIYQDDKDKQVFHGKVWFDEHKRIENIQLNSKDREKLELMLIAADEVEAKPLFAGLHFVPDKRKFSFPLLKGTEDLDNNGFDMVFAATEAPTTTFFDTDDQHGVWLYSGDPEEYFLPVYMTFYGVHDKEDDDVYKAVDNGDFTGCTRLGEMSGYLIMCSDMVKDGANPVEMGDDLSADLGAVMSALSDENGPLNDEIGDPFDDVLYIDEIEMEEQFRGKDIECRILREIPWLCKRLLHVFPNILSYHIGYYLKEVDRQIIRDFYHKNGFNALKQQDILYAYTEW